MLIKYLRFQAAYDGLLRYSVVLFSYLAVYNVLALVRAPPGSPTPSTCTCTVVAVGTLNTNTYLVLELGFVHLSSLRFSLSTWTHSLSLFPTDCGMLKKERNLANWTTTVMQ